MKKLILLVITIVIMSTTGGVFAQTGQDDSMDYNNSSDAGTGVNSGSFGLILQGGFGYGATMFGVLDDSSSSSSIGVGPGAGFDFGVMANYSVFAVKLAYAYSSLEDLKWNQKLSGTTYEMETKGEGDYSTFDASLGLKLLPSLKIWDIPMCSPVIDSGVLQEKRMKDLLMVYLAVFLSMNFPVAD